MNAISNDIKKHIKKYKIEEEKSNSKPLNKENIYPKSQHKNSKAKKIEYNHKEKKICNTEINNQSSSKKKDEKILTFDDLLIKKKDIQKKPEHKMIKRKKNIKIDFTGRLYQNKKSPENKKVQNIRKKTVGNKKSKRSSSPNFDNILGFDKFISLKNKEKKEGRIKKIEKKSKNDTNSIRNRSTSRRNNKKIIKNFLERNTPKSDNRHFQKNIDKEKDKRKINKTSLSIYLKNQKIKDKKVNDFNNWKNGKMNKSDEYRNHIKIINMKKLSQGNDLIEAKNRKKNIKVDKGVPLGVTEVEMNLALKNRNFFTNIIKKHSSSNCKNNRFLKYNLDNVRYEFIKDYSRIHPRKEDGFIRRMQFDSLKRQTQLDKLNDLVKKNIIKMDESEREKAFKRLMDDGNRRLISRRELECQKEKNLTEVSPVVKKYKNEEWNEIYNKRFKDYEEYKKKKSEIQRQKEKIQKMINEEEIKMWKIKKIPTQKISHNTFNLFDTRKKNITKYQKKDKKNTFIGNNHTQKNSSSRRKVTKYSDFKKRKLQKYLTDINHSLNSKGEKIVESYLYNFCTKNI